MGGFKGEYLPDTGGSGWDQFWAVFILLAIPGHLVVIALLIAYFS